MRTTSPNRRSTPFGRVLLVLVLLLPVQLGGCPEFRNGVVGALDTATRGIMLGSVEPEDALDAAGRGILNAGLDWFFEQWRTDETRF